MSSRHIGSLPKIIRNDDGLYEGDLRHYFKIAMLAKNLNAPYHNWRHMFHVLVLCYRACEYYANFRADSGSTLRISPLDMRLLLIAAIFHDFDHTGKSGNDEINIRLALKALRKHITDEDRRFLDKISLMIRATEFPHKMSPTTLGLGGKILRDADMSQAFDVSWIQQVIFGLASEMGVSPISVLQKQEMFLSSIKFGTDWAKSEFQRNGAITEKIDEARELLELLED